MWPFKKKAKAPKKNIYRVTFILHADVTDDSFVFLKENMREEYIEADDVLDAEIQFVKHGGVVLTPHVCIDRIVKVISGKDRV